jgi:ankyrin repeat protein
MNPRLGIFAARFVAGSLGVLATAAHAQGNAQNNPVRATDRAPTTTARVSSARTNAGAALVAAAARGDMAAVKSLMAQGADVNVAQGDGMTALHWAAERGDAALAASLLKAGARVDMKTRVGGYTPLHVASRSASGAVVKALLAAGADARTPTETGASAMHLAAGAGSAEAIQALVAAKGDVNARETSWGQTPLMFAATSNRADAIKALLKAGADVAVRTRPLDLSEELTRQQNAAKKRNEVLFAALPEQMRDSLKKSMGKAAADQAAQRAAFLGTTVPATTAEFKIGTTAPPTSSLTPSQIQAAILAGREVFNTPAAPKPINGETGELLEGNIAGYEGTVGSLGGLTALLHSARQGNTAATLALIDGGADINEVSATDSTSPLLIAAINGHFDLAMQLVKRGANVKRASTAGLTPLYATINTFWAPRSRYPQPQSVQTQQTTHLELMQAMIKAGADVNTRLKKNLWFFAFSNCGNANCGLEQLEGTTPFWRATYAVDLEAMRMLKAAGADDTMPSFRSAAAGGRGGRGGAAPGPGAAALAAGRGGAPGAPGAPAGAALAGRGAGGADGPGGPAAGPVDAATDSASKAVPAGIGVFPIHTAAGVGYGNGFAGNSHRHAADGWMPTLRYLVEELHHDVNKRDNGGYTPLHHAAARGDNEMILYLVSKGADVKAVARNFRTTVDMANGPVQRLRPLPETILLLEKLGAKNSHKCVSC